MKEQIQQTGVRKWFGNDWLDIQDELMDILEAHFGQFNKQFILSGCTVAATTISAGIVVLNVDNEYKLCRFSGATGITFPVFLKPDIVEEKRLYLDGDVKPVARSYNAVLSAVDTGGLLQMKQDNTMVRFTDIIQDSTHRMVSDEEKETWSGQVGFTLSTIRGGIISTLNTLEKLRVHLQQEIDNVNPDSIDVNKIYSTIRGGIADNLDTLKKLYDSITGAFVRDLLSALVNDERLDASAIKNLQSTITATEVRDKLQTLVGDSRLLATAIRNLNILNVYSGSASGTGGYRYWISKAGVDGKSQELLRIQRADAGDDSITVVSDTIFNNKVSELEQRLTNLGG